MEDWDWIGLWQGANINSGFYTDAFVSSNLSASIYAIGAGSSSIESDTYELPNITGLNTGSQYQLRFRLASYTFSNPTASTRGVDVADYVNVRVSTDGGATYVTELRITGNNNATWPYTSTGSITHTSNGIFTNSAAPAGDVYQSPVGVTTTGPTFITLNLPTGLSQVAVNIFCRANADGEEWWIDDIELFEIYDCSSLPIELLIFEGRNEGKCNNITWVTLSETNNHYFTLERSSDGVDWSTIEIKNGAGFSNTPIMYEHKDYEFKLNSINYYRLTQTDYDGQQETFNIIAVYNLAEQTKFVIKRVTIEGKEIDDNYRGLYIEIYNDGTARKVFKY